MENIKRRENESYLTYAKRITEDRRAMDLDYSEWVKLLIGKDYSSDNARKAYYILQPFIERLENERVEDITDEDILNELEMKRIELEKERKKKQAINVEYNKLIREQARTELYWERIEEILSNRKPLDKPNIIVKPNGKREALLAISDQHFGRENKIYGLDGEIISEYSPEIFKTRMWTLLEETVIALKEKKLNHLHIYNLADCIDGLLRISQLASLRLGVTDSIIEFAEFMASWLDEFSKRNIKIDYYQCWGNHDEIRVLTGNKGDFPHENANKLIMKLLEKDLRDNDNVTVHNTKSPFIYQDILGMKVFGYHGEDKNLVNATRWFRRIYNCDIDMVIGGHLHSQSLTTEGIGKFGDVQCIRVSSICGIDDYSMSLRSCARAGATMFVFEEGKGKTETKEFWLN